jgi:hypothetical protein
MFNVDIQMVGRTDRDRQTDTRDEAIRHFLHFAFVPKLQIWSKSGESEYH